MPGRNSVPFRRWNKSARWCLPLVHQPMSDQPPQREADSFRCELRILTLEVLDEFAIFDEWPCRFDGKADERRQYAIQECYSVTPPNLVGSLSCFPFESSEFSTKQSDHIGTNAVLGEECTSLEFFGY